MFCIIGESRAVRSTTAGPGKRETISPIVDVVLTWEHTVRLYESELTRWPRVYAYSVRLSTAMPKYYIVNHGKVLPFARHRWCPLQHVQYVYSIYTISLKMGNDKIRRKWSVFLIIKANPFRTRLDKLKFKFSKSCLSNVKPIDSIVNQHIYNIRSYIYNLVRKKLPI